MVHKLLSEPNACKAKAIYQEWYWDACNKNAPNSSTDIDTWWDGLHYVQTSVFASVPIEGDPLSEAMVEQTCFPSTLAVGDFLAYNTPERLPAVIAALEALDWQALKGTFNPLQMSHEGIYPENLWESTAASAEETKEIFAALKGIAKSFCAFVMRRSASGCTSTSVMQAKSAPKAFCAAGLTFGRHCVIMLR